MFPPLLDQLPAYGIGLRRIGRSAPPHTRFREFRARGIGHFRKDQRLGEIDGRGNQDKALEPLRLKACVQSPCGKQGEPAAHRRSGEDLRAIRQSANCGEAFLEPSPDGSSFKTAFGQAMPGIVEAEKGAAALLRINVEVRRFQSAHVRPEAAKPDDTRARYSGLWRAAQIRDAACTTAAPHREKLRNYLMVHASSSRFARVHRFARLMIVKKSGVILHTLARLNAVLSDDASF